MQKITTIIPYESEQIQQVRYDIVLLKEQLLEVEKKIDVFHQCQYEFDLEYQNLLGDLADAVFALRVELGMVGSTSAVVPAITHLADTEYQQLKTAYRQAAKLCHPDQLSEEHLEIGLQLFDTLNKAYHLQDLVQVEYILWLLQTEQAFSQTPVRIKSVSLLYKQKELLELLVVQKNDYLDQQRIHEEYDITDKDNWNSMLYNYQTQLEDELALLRNKLN